MRAGDAGLALEDEGRHGGDAHAAHILFQPRYVGGLLGPALHAALGGDVGEHLRVADVAGLFEVRGEERIHDLVALALFLGQGDQPVGLRGVGLALHALEREVDALAPAFGDHARVELLRALERAELGLAVLGARDAVRRQIGIELERQPAHFDLDFVLEKIERLLEALLADVAPRTDYVRRHFDLQLLHLTSSSAPSRSRRCGRWTRASSPASRCPCRTGARRCACPAWSRPTAWAAASRSGRAAGRA